MSNTVIVGVDGSDTALAAAKAAARLAAALGAELEVVTAYQDSNTEVLKVAGEVVLFSTEREAKKVADSIAKDLREHVEHPKVAALAGKPAEVLIEEAKRIDAAIIVVGNRRMQGLGRVLGSVANDVAHHASCDVYIVNTA